MNLYILGKLKKEDKRAVAIVGTRLPTERGKKLTEEFVKELVKNEITIVSGLARGIDTIAHLAALNCGGRTIAVIGSGLNVIYPPENKKLAEEISKNGALVSGFPYGTKPEGKNFLARNQLIVKLSKAVLVIEGKARSGTISTANHAANDGVEVFAIPGSEATDYLIENGATPVQKAFEIVDYLDTL
ncbi:MAG: protecting protein DprA protein [Candidatus Woesebacteria bacterium GW2011_GWA1_33_30]|uniref:Protecting protein DprA protein n=1 Tax=Candidatus Woesebacteria bacterium GW2011_GWA2_33_28 TaxID=1618561 RepID=A0A0G0CX18_9BACT|nr:MAG: protecting protein DprA protein [Candidatus Woesebacteria bacterium GW2011_GWA2_33_28]KKP48770.1 MAG: protecting protein DprA protein [Candidatus Woesebacteria bacterium GW2011_GWA1_33_30]KKP50043.1 MAG: protecting protein DprA protein [Microgenomates group bacterium GW2011_GWC1_33_32]KKP51814.1 MAG: protecting protein DprA protein [Candidatus Woesebacteria bacterium GW2011_GWB1_33_38]KKP57814.1 MAG: protecting protein DprA protein [Microgenomates group bacterium GW2011_GWD1_33_9]